MNFIFFALAHFFAVLSPGPTLIGMVNVATNSSFKNGAYFVLGVGVGNFILSTLAVFGLSEIIFKFKMFSIIFYICSGSYLFYIGVHLLKKHKNAEAIKINPKKAFITGLITESSNPKAVFFTASIVAIFITPESTNLMKYFAIAWLVLVGIFYEFIIVWLCSIYKTKILKYLKYLNKIFGTLLIAFSLRLLFWAFEIIRLT